VHAPFNRHRSIYKNDREISDNRYQITIATAATLALSGSVALYLSKWPIVFILSITWSGRRPQPGKLNELSVGGIPDYFGKRA